MEFVNFMDAVKNEVESRIGENGIVTLSEVTKNNGLVLSGLSIQSKDSNISPIIYLNNHYQAYESGAVELEEIISDILEVYEKNKMEHIIDMSQFLNYENIREKIVYKLINTDMNKELLQQIPHMAFHDLSIVFQVVLTEGDFGHASILIRNENLAIWNVSLDELYEDARNNTPTLYKYEINDLEDLLKEFVPTDETVRTHVSMLVLSNKNKLNGAACLLYPDLLKQISDAMDSNMYILPSSVHEVLLLPTDEADAFKNEHLKNMVREVNDTQVEEEELLSYSIYYYDRNADEIIRL